MMKLLFICGGMEPGKDGVGDYTRRLAGELIRQGHHAAVMAINDRHIETTVQEFQIDEQKSISVLRLPAQMSWKDRANTAKDFLEEFQAEWISLQYVPYSFHEKGLPWKLQYFLKNLNFLGQWHVMLHELWIGINTKSSIVHKAIGYFQAFLTLNLLNHIRPALITTSNLLSIEILKAKGVHAIQLPLFSNIPYVESNVEQSYHLLNISPETMVIGVFGTLYPNARLDELLDQLQLEKNIQPIVLLSFGRIGDKKIWYNLQEKWKHKVQFILLGELDKKDVSIVMQRVNIALSCTPLEYLGKSGVYAAWKRHGVPVMALSSDSFKNIQADFKIAYQKMEAEPIESWDVKNVILKFISLLTR